MRILICGTSFSSSYGGPAYSVSRLANGIAELGAQVALWSPDNSTFAPASLALIDGKVERLGGKLEDALGQIGNPDVIHDNGLWLGHNHRIAKIARGRKIPRIVSIRGMLQPWALQQKSLKKQLAWLLYQKNDLLTATVLHATADDEVEAIKSKVVNANVVNIPNGTDLPSAGWLESVREKKDHKTVLFLSRIHPKKGLLMLLEAWAIVRPRRWKLVIAGPDEDGHRRQVEALITKLGLINEIELVGEVQGKAKERLFANSELFILPTYSENFGIVVAEALAHQLPVITTTGAPWAELTSRKCGWWVDPEPKAIADALKVAITTPGQELVEMGRRGRNFVESEYEWKSISNRFLDLYGSLVNV